jgi:hypothetical protein
MINRNLIPLILRKGAAIALAAFLLLQALPVSFHVPFPLVGETSSEEIHLTTVNICDGDGSAGFSLAGDFLCTPLPLSPPPPGWTVPGLPPDDRAPPPVPSRRLYRPPRPVPFS